MAAENYTNTANEEQGHLEGFMKENGIEKGMSKREYLKNNGSEGKWNTYQRLSKRINGFREKANYHQEKAVRTDKTIASWQKNAPKLFSLVDGKDVDFLLYSFLPTTDNNGKEVLGSNAIDFTTTEGGEYIWRASGYGFVQEKAINIKIDQYVTTDAPQPSIHGPQYLLNHEAGHFLHMVENTAEYIKFRKEQDAKGINPKGGHSEGDKSGIRAVEYGKTKDIKE